MLRQGRKFLFWLPTFLIFISCAPTKNTATRRAYHNLVSRYNIYFNGKEALLQGIRQLEQNHKDHYGSILPIYMYADETARNGIIPLMDRAAEKGTKVILKHSMNFNGVEYNKWVDDSYMLIGKSRFYKNDYLGAREIFDFVSKTFNKQPVYYDALLWMAKTYLYEKKYSKIDVLFGIIDGGIQKQATSQWVVQHYPIIRAMYHIETGTYEQAIVYLEKALQNRIPRKLRMRTLFVLGQVYQRLGNDQKALEYYERCLKMNPPYELAFHARIYAAECYTGDKKGRGLVDQLHKMAKDPKNKDYLDEIYYALANIELKKGNTQKAIEYLMLSVQSSVKNNLQKGLSFYRLAVLHFEMKKYQQSQQFYDSTIRYLPKTYENYTQIQKQADMLGRLMTQLNTIELEDSLQRLAAMSERERLMVIDRIIADLIAKEEEQRRLEQERMLAAMQQRNPDYALPQAGGGEWYFYNPSAVNFGKNEFRRIWGPRPLEDLWRLQNKEANMFDSMADEIMQQDSSDSLAQLNNPKERAYYLKNIPDTPEKIQESNKRLIDAHFMAGMIYKNELKDYEPAIDMFERLLQRFPDNKYQLQTYYSLYLLYGYMNNSTQQEKYKQLIFRQYPDSDVAKMIQDPEYYQKLKQQGSFAQQYYSQTWHTYQRGDYARVILMCDSAIRHFVDPELLPKFHYLKAVSKIRIDNNIDSMLVVFDFIIKNYPQSEIKNYVENIYHYYTKQDTEEPISVSVRPESSQQLFRISADAFHMFILLTDVKNTNINELKILIADFHAQYFRDKNLTVSSLFLTDHRYLITVNRFQNQAEAMRYYQVFVGNSGIIQKIENADPGIYVISTDNYPILYRTKNEQAYKEFFRRYYIEN